ncbi:MAG TPA: VWA domain-containing protein [Vicinamibacterales bacterium]|nr:VWA domain-containing protein [Vicinamibacterales bacterium]
MSRAAALVALAMSTAATLGAQEGGTFRAATRLVLLQATVVDERGAPVTDLNRDAFAVYENRKRQPIELFRREDVPVSIGLLIDNSGSMRTLRAKVEAAALAFARASNPMDELCVVNFADKVDVDVPFTSDLDVLERRIVRVDSIGGTALWDAIDTAQSYVGDHASRPRKVLLVVTDGNDNASVARLSLVVRQAQRREIVVDAVGLFGGDTAKAVNGRRDLEQLTRETGGNAYFPVDINQIEAVVVDLARQIRNQYVIAYSPLNAALDGTYRAIRVTATSPGKSHLEVRTRRGYVAN